MERCWRWAVEGDRGKRPWDAAVGGTGQKTCEIQGSPFLKCSDSRLRHAAVCGKVGATMACVGFKLARSTRHGTFSPDVSRTPRRHLQIRSMLDLAEASRGILISNHSVLAIDLKLGRFP